MVHVEVGIASKVRASSATTDAAVKVLDTIIDDATRWAVLERHSLSKGKGRAPVDLALANLAETALAIRLVLLSFHLDIGLRIAPDGMVLVESTVAAIENVDLGICQFRVARNIERPIFLANMLCPSNNVSREKMLIKRQTNMRGARHLEYSQ